MLLSVLDHVEVTTVNDDAWVITDVNRILMRVSRLPRKGVIHYASEGPPLLNPFTTKKKNFPEPAENL